MYNDNYDIYASKSEIAITFTNEHACNTAYFSDADKAINFLNSRKVTKQQICFRNLNASAVNYIFSQIDDDSITYHDTYMKQFECMLRTNEDILNLFRGAKQMGIVNQFLRCHDFYYYWISEYPVLAVTEANNIISKVSELC